MDRILEIVVSNAGSATVMALAVALASRFIRRPVILHVLWLFVLLRLFAPPLVEIPLLPASAGGVTLPAVTASPSVDPARTPNPPAEPSFSVTAIDVAWWLWLAGAGFIAVVSIVRMSRIRNVIKSGQPTPWSLSTRIEALATTMGVRHPPVTTVVDATVPPMLWGPLGALRLVLPSPLLEQLNDSERDTLIAHELAHVRRRDHLVRHLELAAMVVFWWLPVTWWARRRLRSAEELCCDGLVAQSLPGQGRAYADCLVKTMNFLSDHQSPIAAVCSGLGGLAEMKGRIRMIMTHPTRPSLPPIARVLLVLAVVTGLAVFPSLTARDATADAATERSEITYAGERIDLNIEEAKLRDLLTTFAKVADLNFVVDPTALSAGLLETTVSKNTVDTPWDQVLDEILASIGLSWTLEGNVLWIHLPGTSFEGDREFTGEPMNLNLEDAELTDVLTTFSKILDIVIDVEPDVQGSVTVAFHDVPWDQALDLILRISGCGWSNDGHRLAVFRTTTAVGEQMAVADSAASMRKAPAAVHANPDVIGTLDGRPLFRYREGSRMTAPRRIAGTDPQYPSVAKDGKVEGKVVLETVIDAAGSVRDVFAIRSPSNELTIAAVDAVTLWQFEPATLDDEPVSVHYFLTVNFELE